MSYSGWSNYETWAVKLWMDNEEGTYYEWRERTMTAWESSDHDRDATARELEDALKLEHEEAMPEIAGVWSDLLTAALGEVDWHEIALALIDDNDLTEDSDEPEEAEA